MKTMERFSLTLLLLLSTTFLHAKEVFYAVQEPVTLLFEGNIYTLPLSYGTTERDFTYLTIKGQKVVCHFHSQSWLNTLQPIPNSFEVHGRVIVWNCHRYYESHWSMGP